MLRSSKKFVSKSFIVLAASLCVAACGEQEPSEGLGDDAMDSHDVEDLAELDVDDGTEDLSESTPGDACDKMKSSDVGNGCEVIDIPRCFSPRDVDEIPGDAQLRRGISADGDQLCDDVEAELEYNGTDCSTVADCDGDGLLDDAELLYIEDQVGARGWATKLDDPDTDGDGMHDLDEIEAGRNPVFAEPTDAENTTVFGGSAFGYLSHVAFADPHCCTTQFGAGAYYDNELPGFLFRGDGTGAYPVTIDDVHAGLTEAVQDMSSAILFEFDGLPTDLAGGARNDATIQIRSAAVVGAASIGEREAGDGQYSLDAQGDSSLLEAMIVDGHVEASAGELVLPIALSTVVPLYSAVYVDGALANDFPLTLRRVTLSFDIQENTSPNAASSTIGIESVEEIRLAGAVAVEEVVAMHNALLAECYPTYVGPFITVTEPVGSDSAYVACNQTSPEVALDSSALGGRCAELTETQASYCSLLEEIIYPDTDTNGNGVADAISVGLRLTLSGASRTE